MSLVSMLTWWLVGYLTGILVFIVAPILAGAAPVGDQYRFRFVQWYFDLAMSALRRVLCGITPHNDMHLIRTSFDSERQTESVEFEGEEQEYQDQRGMMLRFKNKVWNFVLTDVDRIIHPMDAEIGSVEIEREENDEVWVRWGDVKGAAPRDEQAEEIPSDQIVGIDPFVRIPERIRSVNFQDVRAILPESHEPNDPEKVKENVKNSQQGFGSHSVMSMLMIFASALAGSGLAWLIWSNSDGGDSVVTLPMALVGVVV